MLCGQYPTKSEGKELKIMVQPESQHRARYLTEGSRGSVKDRTQQGFPTVKVGWGHGSAVSGVGREQGLQSLGQWGCTGSLLVSLASITELQQEGSCMPRRDIESGKHILLGCRS